MPNWLHLPPDKTSMPCNGVVVSGKQDACPPVLTVVAWHREAPTKPPWGAPCNGCGLCCLAEPCPLGIWVSGRRTGACRALLWDDALRRYQCGLLTDPTRITGWRHPWLLHWCRRLAQRWIAAGTGCDADIEWETISSTGTIESKAPSDNATETTNRSQTGTNPDDRTVASPFTMPKKQAGVGLSLSKEKPDDIHAVE